MKEKNEWDLHIQPVPLPRGCHGEFCHLGDWSSRCWGSLHMSWSPAPGERGREKGVKWERDVCVCVCMCACVRERERGVCMHVYVCTHERKRERERERSVCACVCVRERVITWGWSPSWYNISVSVSLSLTLLSFLMSLVFVKKNWLPLATEGERGYSKRWSHTRVPFSKEFLLINSHLWPNNKKGTLSLSALPPLSYKGERAGKLIELLSYSLIVPI